MDFLGKTAVVTGAAAGIGQALAWRLAEAGAAVVRVADVANLDETCAGLEQRQVTPEAHSVDVTDPEQLATVITGDVDVVCNNAGIMAGDPQWPETPVERIRTEVSVNLLGVMYGTRLAIDALAARGGGVVLNTSSIASFAPMPNDPMYSATKAAVSNFTMSCAPLAVTHNVRVCAVLPGVVETAILAKSGDGEEPAEWLRPVLAQIAKLQPAQLANAAVEFIADDTCGGHLLVVTNPAEAGGAPVITRIADNATFHTVAMG